MSSDSLVYKDLYTELLLRSCASLGKQWKNKFLLEKIIEAETLFLVFNLKLLSSAFLNAPLSSVTFPVLYFVLEIFNKIYTKCNT